MIKYKHTKGMMNEEWKVPCRDVLQTSLEKTKYKNNKR